MELEIWTKLARILTHHELWPDVEVLIGLATEQHRDFSPPIDVNNNYRFETVVFFMDLDCSFQVLEAMILRAVGSRNPERKLKKLKGLVGNSKALRHMSPVVKNAVRKILLLPIIDDDDLHDWLASFTNWG